MLSLIKLTPLPIMVVILGLICPTELSLFVGSLRLPPHRLMITLMFALAVVRFVTRSPIQLASYDVLFFLYAVWTLAVFAFHPDGSVEYGGALALESFCAYFIARVYIRDLETFRATLGFLFVSVLVVGAIALPEAIFKQHYVHVYLHKLTGIYLPLTNEERVGLLRAFSTFDHPIHYGTFCASILALVWFASTTNAASRIRSALVLGFAFLGLSSAPILCAGAQIAFTAWEAITRRIQSRFMILAIAIISLYLIVDLLSDRNPLSLLIANLTLDPWTGIYRTYIWHYGLQNVWDNPLIGIGLADWKRADWMHAPSIDAFWLVIMMRAGIPALVLLSAAILLLLRKVHTSKTAMAALPTQAVKMGWTISLLALSLAACTVHYWNSIHAYFFVFLGMAGWLADPKFALKAALVPRRQQMPPVASAPGNNRVPATRRTAPARA